MSVPLRKFRFSDSPLRWEFDVKGERVASLQQLLEKFYDEWQWDRKFLGWHRDDGKTKTEQMISPERIIAPYRKNFYIEIERAYNEIFGPHVARLLYRPWQVPGDVLWVGIIQINCMWHSDEKMKICIVAEINRKSFYQSEDTAATIVTL